MKKEVTIIVPSFKSEVLTYICVNSFEKFKTDDLTIKYIVVENSKQDYYRKNIEKISPNVIWINNNTKLIGSEANAEALVVGLGVIDTEFCFLCHCDTCVTSSLFYDEMFKKVEDDYKMIGTGTDNTRIKACHISGVFVETKIAKTVNMFPIYEDNKMIMDVGDDITKYCRDHKVKHCCLENTFNSFNEKKLTNDKYKGFRVNRSVNDNGEVLFMHLGRGIPKSQGTYHKEGRVYLEGWIDFCTELLDAKS